jgi:hypothetical protein
MSSRPAQEATMLSVFSPELRDNADQLESRRGVPVALEMLREHVITPLDFLELCQEAASATGSAPGSASDPVPPRSQVA